MHNSGLDISLYTYMARYNNAMREVMLIRSIITYIEARAQLYIAQLYYYISLFSDLIVGYRHWIVGLKYSTSA